MRVSEVRTLLIALIVSFCGFFGEGYSTCKDLESGIAIREAEIESLKLLLEEYKFVADEKEDKSDECSKYSTCSKCLRESHNPSCGWCFLRNRCSLQENCPSSASNSDLWISGSDRCPKIRAVKPHLVAAHSVISLHIFITQLPDYDGLFLCSFEMLGKTIFSKGRKTDSGITCLSPKTAQIPNIPQGSVDLQAKLSVRIPNIPIFASTSNFTIYDCDRYTSCTECTSSSYPCAWCVSRNRCTHDVDQDCKKDVIVFSKAVTRLTLREGPGLCSRITPYVDNRIFVPSGISKRIQVKVENLVHFQVTSRFSCRFGSRVTVSAMLLGDVIYCDSMVFRVIGRSPILNQTLNVYWGENKFDNVENIHVVVYHCGLSASSCGECLDLPHPYNCGWCEDSNSCTNGIDCGEIWLDKRKTCTKPEITSFYPKSGLLTSPTSITINGINFGANFEDIRRVTLISNEQGIDIVCRPFEHLFVPNSRIVCQLDVSEINPEFNEAQNISIVPSKGHFEVRISENLVAVSEDAYSFVDPSITGIEPVKGVKSGGTLLYIKGHHLDAGNKIDAFVGDLPCMITSRDFSTIRCTTSPSPRTRSNQVKVLFDGEERTSNEYFFYVEDPYISSVRSGTGSNHPSGTLSGGNLVIVEGDDFDHVPNPYMYVIVDDIEYPGECEVMSDKRMECTTPRFPTDVLNFCNTEGFVASDYGFRMENVEDVQNISLKENFGKFHIYPDPFFRQFSEEGMTKIFKSDYITINGKYMDTVFDETDIAVHIGADECTVTSLSHTQLICRPPTNQPGAKNGDGRKLPKVVVKVLDRLEFFIGFLQYSKKEDIFFK